MPITVVTDPLDPVCNSFVSVDEVGAYLLERVIDLSEADVWSNLDVNQQIAYVVNASRDLDNMVDWIGERYSRGQRFSWPRYDAYVDGYYLDVTTVPLAVKEATIELIRFRMANNGLFSVTQNSAYDAIKVGPITIDFNQSALGTTTKYFPDEIAYILADYGRLNPPELPGQNRLKQVRLVRA